MFGLEKQKKKKAEPFVFDLEKELKNPGRYKELLELVDKRILRIKEILRGGEEKGDYNQFGALILGYTALMKVFARANKAK